MSILFRALGIAYALMMLASAFFFMKDRFALHDWFVSDTPIASLAGFATLAFVIGALRSFGLLASRFTSWAMLLPLSAVVAYVSLALHAGGSGFAVLYSEALWLTIGYPLALAASGALWLISSFGKASAPARASAVSKSVRQPRQGSVTSRGSRFDFAT